MAGRVVVLSGHSLFAEGITRRLQQYLQLAELDIMDPRQPDVLARLKAARPSFVILDTTDPDVAQSCPLSKLLLAVPDLQVICLDPQRGQIQVVTGESHMAAKVSDLAEVIKQSTRDRAGSGTLG